MKVNFAELLASFLIETTTNMHSLILSKKEIEELLKIGYLEKYKDAYRITDGAYRGVKVTDNNIDKFINQCLDESWAKMCEMERKKEWLKLLDGRARSERALLEARAQSNEYLSEWIRERKELEKAVKLLRMSVIFLRECWQTSDSDTDSYMVDKYHEINNIFEKYYEEPSEV